MIVFKNQKICIPDSHGFKVRSVRKQQKRAGKVAAISNPMFSAFFLILGPPIFDSSLAVAVLLRFFKYDNS